MTLTTHRPPPSLIRGLLAVCGLLTLGMAAASTPAVPNTAQAVQVASSAQLVLDAEIRPGALILWITRTRNHMPVSGAGNVSVRVEGHPVKVTAQRDDYVVATGGLHGGKQPIEVIVAHDGIRELLSGTVTLRKAPSTLERLQKHSGWAWWVLNIAVLLLAFRMISRRKKAP